MVVGLKYNQVHRTDFWPEPPDQCDDSAILLHRKGVHDMLDLYAKFVESGHICSS